MTKLRFTVHGKTGEIEIKSGETVLEALQREDIDAPFSCQGGFCGSCKAIVESGQAEMLSNDYLSDEEVGAGWILTCRAEPRSDFLQVRFEDE